MKTVTMGCTSCVNEQYETFILSYPFEKNDGGRTSSKRPKQKNDCAVRALATACKMDYDAAYDLLAAEGRKCSRGFHLQKWLNGQLWAKKIAFQAIKDQRRMNIATFCKQFQVGRFICRTAKHVFAVVDGVVQDTWEQRADRCVYTAWEIICLECGGKGYYEGFFVKETCKYCHGN